MADSRDELEETDETNNVKPGVSLSDMMLPNFRIDSVEANPELPDVGDKISWAVNVINNGPGNGPGFTVTMDDDEDPADPLAKVDAGALGYEKAHTVEFTRAAMAGEVLYFFVDPTNAIDETDETDNIDSRDLSEMLPVVGSDPVQGQSLRRHGRVSILKRRFGNH